MMYWMRVSSRETDQVLMEYESIFTDIDEAVEDVRRMVDEGHISYVHQGYKVELFSTHPDFPGVKPLKSTFIRIHPEYIGGS